MPKTEPRRAVKRLELDGQWDLLEFTGFGRQYIQLYSFFYSVRFGAPDEEDAGLADDRVAYAFRGFPWRGGWSSVDFFEVLRHAIPAAHRIRDLPGVFRTS